MSMIVSAGDQALVLGQAELVGCLIELMVSPPAWPSDHLAFEACAGAGRGKSEALSGC